MATSFVPDALAPIIGRDARALDEGALRRLAQLPERDVLDLKREPSWSTDSEKLDIASDVAALANHRGGLIVVGLDEQGAGQPAQLHPMPPGFDADAAELSLRGILLARCFPAIDLDIFPVTGAAGTYLVLSVPPSSLKPHAVSHNKGFRYPVRDGAGKRYLTESEVATAYRDRHTMVESQLDGLRVRLDLSRSLATQMPGKAWTIFSLHPTREGSTRQTRDRATAVEQDLRARIGQFPGLSLRGPSSIKVRPGYRSFRFHDGLNSEPYLRFGELYLNGGGTVAIASVVRSPGGEANRDHAVPSEPIQLGDEELVANAINALSFLRYWAVDICGAGGDALLATQIVPGTAGVQLWQFRGDFPSYLSDEILSHETPVSTVTLQLAELEEEGAPFLVAVRAIAQDLMSHFGFIEPPQISPDGRLIRHYWKRDRWQLIERWIANGRNVEIG